MKYKKFIIQGYRGMTDSTELDISKESLIPIIGKNESGKTTCLEAISAFDYSNDGENGGKHLVNVQNLYSTVEKDVLVSAIIDIESGTDFLDDFKTQFDIVEKEFKKKYPEDEFDVMSINLSEEAFTHSNFIEAYQKLINEINAGNSIIIVRDLKRKVYYFPLLSGLLPDDFMNTLGESCVASLPYILYFDDFRDRIPEKLYITSDDTNAQYSTWIKYIDELFKQTKKEYSVFTLPTMQDSRRRSILGEVKKHLNKVLAEEWSKYQFERKESISIDIEYREVTAGSFLYFKIVEEVDVDGEFEDRFFDISDRSKGFYWYFNFMIKLHFNHSKRDFDDKDTIYLLDEPGSYLHTYALNKLAEQLKRLSLNNTVIYCTHFHNLLNPEFIPINSIRISEKIDKGKIDLKRVSEIDAKLIRGKKNSAYQPVLDALEVKPPLFEYDIDNIVLLEGIYDFYSFKMFTSEDLSYFPCVSASSINNQIPYMIFLGKNYLALWDDDDEGRSRLEKANELFGEVESRRFLVLSSIEGNKNSRLEEYFDQTEIDQFKENFLNEKSSLRLEKIILKLFYAENKNSLILEYFPKTKSNFSKMEGILKQRLGISP